MTQSTKERSSFDVEDIIQKVKVATRDANVGGRGAEDAVVTGVTLNLQIVQELKAGGDVHWTVPVVGLELGANLSGARTATSTIEVSLVPPPPAHGVALALVPGIDLVKDLTDAINLIRRSIAAGAAGDPPYLLDAASIELAFEVNVDGGLSLVAAADRSKTTTNTLKLTLGRPMSPRDLANETQFGSNIK